MKIIAATPPTRVPGRAAQGGPAGSFVRSARTPVDPKREVQLMVRGGFKTCAKTWRYADFFERIGFKQFFPGQRSGPACVVAAFLDEAAFNGTFVPYPGRGHTVAEPIVDEFVVTPLTFVLNFARPSVDYNIIAGRFGSPVLSAGDPPAALSDWWLAWYRDDSMNNPRDFYVAAFGVPVVDMYVPILFREISGETQSTLHEQWRRVIED